jgi:hypothetical protein
MRTDGQTDMAKVIVTFRSFANAPKMCIVLLQCTHICALCYCYNKWSPCPHTASQDWSFLWTRFFCVTCEPIVCVMGWVVVKWWTKCHGESPPPEYFVLPCLHKSIIPPVLRTHLRINAIAVRRTSGQRLGNFTGMFFRVWGGGGVMNREVMFKIFLF